MDHIRLEIETDKKSIREIIENIISGKWNLYIPAFQREFVWDEDDVRDFFDSVLRKYPVGTIILWQHEGYDPENDPFAEPLVSDSENNSAKKYKKYYILDGQQRLTSIMLLYYDWNIKRANRTIKLEVPIAFRLTDKKLIKSKKMGVDLAQLIKSYIDGELSKVINNYTSNNHRDLLKEISRKILEYEIPIYILTTYGDFNKAVMEMARAFVRVNREGVRIGGVELQISLLTGHIGGAFSKLVRDNYTPLKQDYFLDLVPFLRFIISNFGLKQTDISKVAYETPESFRKKLEKVDLSSDLSSGKLSILKEIFNKSSSALKLTLEIIKSELGLKRSSFLPSQLTLIPIATYLYSKGIDSIKSLDHNDIEKILTWFIIANFRGRYTSRTDSKLQKDIGIVKNCESFPLDELLKEIRNPKITLSDLMKGNEVSVLRKSGQQYLFLLFIALTKEGADDWTGVLIKKRDPNELAKHHIFPKEFLENSEVVPDEPREKETFISSLGNITFINKDLNAEIGDTPPEEYLDRYLGSIDKHFIPGDKDLWILDNYEKFKEKRVKILYEAFRRHFPRAFD